MNAQYNLKPVTLYVAAQLYEKYQLQAQKQGRKTAELIHNAMQDYADEHFKTKNSMNDIDFSRTVTLKAGAQDFFWMIHGKRILQVASCYLSNNITSIITANPKDFEIFQSFELQDYTII